MQLIRRSAFRAINSSIATPRTLSTRTPFTVRPKSQSLSSTLFRRFASNDVSSETQEPPADTSARRTSESSSSPSSADQDDSSSIKSAIDSATESASTYASDAAESVSESYNSVKESVTDYAQAAGAAAGFSAPRSDRGQGEFQERRPYDRRDGDRARPAPVPTNSIYIGNLLFDATEADLRTLFTPYGEISKVTLATDLRGLSKGFAYVEFASTEEATAAIEGQHQQEFEGRRLIVNYQNKTKREIQKNDPSKTLFIGNLAFEMSDADLTKLFKDVRNVVDVRVAVDRRTGQPRGFAHAEFTDVDSATKGIDLLQGKEVYGRPIRCDFSGGGLRRDNQDGAEGRPERRGGYGGDRRGGGGGRGGYGGDRGGDRRSSGGYGGDRGNDRGGRGGYGGGERRGGGRGGGGYGGDQEGSSGRY